jgi:hypothetical protein
MVLLAPTVVWLIVSAGLLVATAFIALLDLRRQAAHARL